MVVDMDIFENNQINLFPSVTFTPKAWYGVPKNIKNKKHFISYAFS